MRYKRARRRRFARPCLMDGAFATLRMNGWVLDATEREAAELFEQVAAGDLDEPTLAAWLERNSMAV
jgi:hypothetical protein